MKNCVDRILVLAILVISSISLSGQQWIIDSLEQELPNAQPGYDQIDYYLGLTRAATMMRQKETVKEYLDKAYQISVKHNDLAGQSQAKVFYHLMARNFGGDQDQMALYAKEAYELGLESGDLDALTFAVYQYAEVLARYHKKNDQALALLIDHQSKLDSTVTLKNKANFLKTLGHAQARHGDEESAIKNFKKALALLEIVRTNPDKQHRLGRVSALYADKGIINAVITQKELASTLAQKGRLSEAIELTEQNLNFVKDIGNTDYTAWLSFVLGNFRKKNGDYAAALQLYKEATVIWEKDPTAKRDIALLKIPMGEIYTETGDYAGALQSFQYAMDYSLTIADTSSYLSAAILRAGCLSAKGDGKQAYSEITQAEAIAVDYGAKENIAEVRLKKAEIEHHIGQHQASQKSLKSALAYFEASNDRARLPEIYTAMAENEIALNNADEAIDHLQQAISLSKEYNLGDQLSKSYHQLADLYKAKGDYKSALSNFELFHESENNLLTQNAQEILREEQVRQNVNQFKEEKEAATALASLLQTRNKLYIGLAASLLGFLLVGSYLYQQIRKSRSIIQKRNKELADLNATKDKFFGIIAHDIRSPLVALSGVGKRMDYYIAKGKTDKLKSMSSKVGRTADHLSALLDNLLNWALLQRNMLPHKPERITLHELVAECLRMFQLNADMKGIQLINQVDLDVSVHADVTAINTIVRNLVSNAVKFTPQGGKIIISSELTDHNVILRVQDNGIGIAPEKAKKIFDLQPNRDKGTDGEKGTGLGLMLCKELAELNQGDISLQSIVDEGTTFVVELPKAA